MGLTLRVVALSGEGQSLINSLKRRTTVSSIFKAASLFGANSSILFVFGSPNSDDISSNAGLMKSTYQSAISKSRSLAICTRTPWHGNNRMERINLPMPAQGGFDYRDPAGLFRRQAEGFEIEVLPWDDPGAVAWRAASAERGLVFRVGEKGGRMYGLF